MRAVVRQQADGVWVGEAGDASGVSAATADECVDELRRVLGNGEGGDALVVEVRPAVAGVAEAARIMGWDKRRVITYISRGRFPEPYQTLASGRIWLRDDVERYAKTWRRRPPRPVP